MKKWLSIVSLLLLAITLTATPDEAATQGYYEGSINGKQMAARVITLGNCEYKVFIQKAALNNDPKCIELFGKVEGEAVTLKGSGNTAGWELSCADGTLKGKSASGQEILFKRVENESPTMGKKPPAGAIVLLDGKNFENICRSNGREWELGDESQKGWGLWETTLCTKAKEPREWPSKENPIPDGWYLTKSRNRIEDVNCIDSDGSIQVAKGGMRSVKNIEGSFDYHVEFLIPLRPDQLSQGRGNSGVYLPCGTEVQVLDSFGMPTYVGGGCGGLYRWINPATMQDIPSLKGKGDQDKFNLASRPPLEWQTYDIEYRVKDENGEKQTYLTVYQNGTKIHDNVKLKNKPKSGVFQYQDHGNPVRYRNIWYLPVK